MSPPQNALATEVAIAREEVPTLTQDMTLHSLALSSREGRNLMDVESFVESARSPAAEAIVVWEQRDPLRLGIIAGVLLGCH